MGMISIEILRDQLVKFSAIRIISEIIQYLYYRVESTGCHRKLNSGPQIYDQVKLTYIIDIIHSVLFL